MADKKTASFRLTIDARRLLAALADALGISQTAALEIAIREMAARKRASRKDTA